MLYFTHLPRSPQWVNLYQIWYSGSPRGRNQLCRIFRRLVQGYWFCRGLKFAYPHRNWRSPLTLPELPFRLWSSDLKLSEKWPWPVIWTCEFVRLFSNLRSYRVPSRKQISAIVFNLSNGHTHRDTNTLASTSYTHLFIITEWQSSQISKIREVSNRQSAENNMTSLLCPRGWHKSARRSCEENALSTCMVSHNYRQPSFKRHNLVSLRFIYIDNIAEEMLNLHCC